VVTNYNKIENDDNSAKHLTNVRPDTAADVSLYVPTSTDNIIISAGASAPGSGDAGARARTSESVHHIIILYNIL